MNYPQAAKPLKANDAKLGGKYRMSNIRSFIALVYLLYMSSNKKSSVDYSDGENRQSQLQLKREYLEKFRDFLGIDVDSIISNNPLLAGQFEYILVTMERIFRLGSVRFNNSSYNNSKERTGGIRYPKTLLFSTNMFILDLIISGFSEEVKKNSLKEWLQNQKASNSEFEEKVTQFLTICSEYTLFRARLSDNNEVIYRPIGIYEQLTHHDEVSIIDSREQAGTSSIYNNVLKEGLNPWLDSKRTDRIKFNNGTDITQYLEMLRTSLNIEKVSEDDITIHQAGIKINNKKSIIETSDSPFFTAISTKPFLLLAGISGTGKSRIVREFAFKSCPKYLQDKTGTTPGNYCMIEVKPNWHDSTELLGYYSRLGKAGYLFTKFVKFLVKAKMFPTVPFFVCLDEMNLAPVEQYFAEILSILETRKHPKNEETGETDITMVKTESIIDALYFRELSEMSHTKNAQTGEPFSSNLTDRDIYLKLFGIDTESNIDVEVGKRTDLTTEGLTLPDNVIIIGTVNMDDTTHQFSRKVIDRAMTIEMNGGNLRNMFGGSKNLEYLLEEEQQEWQNAFTRRYVTADEVLEAHPNEAEELMDKLPTCLEQINLALKGTPFEVSYRVLNELTIMVGVMLDEGKELDDAIAQSVNNILLMKILPRIEGDVEMFALSREYKARVDVSYDNRLEWLKDIAPDTKESSTDVESENNDTEKTETVKEHQQTAKEKIQEMIDRLNNQEFTRFWP
jgi:putative restriction enzyme related protein